MRIHFCILLFSLSVMQLHAASISIHDLVQAAVANHPEVRFYEAELTYARAEGRAARAWADPELSVSFGRKQARADASSLAQEGGAWSVSLAQTFEWPGRVTLRKALADRELALAELAMDGFRAELAGRVRLLAFEVLVARRKADAIERVAARLREVRETFLAREPGGLTPQLEIHVIEAQEVVLHRRATRARLEVDSALIALNQLRGAPADVSLELAGSALNYQEAADVAVLMELAVKKNTPFRARVVELERQGFQTRLARHEGRPAVTLAAYMEEERAGERERTYGLGISVPLPVGGRTAAAVVSADARRLQAEAALASAWRELEAEVVTAVHAYRIHQLDMSRWSTASVDKFHEAAELADRHYRLGAVSLATYVDLQSGYLDAVETVCELEHDVLEAAMKLEALTGGAWRAVEVSP